MIELAAPTLGDAERQALLDVLDSGWLTMGERVRALETAFAALHGVPDAVAVSSRPRHCISRSPRTTSAPAPRCSCRR